MIGSIGHRGPDDDGLLVEGGVGIGMRRLSIVDLSPSGHQPLFNEDRRRSRSCSTARSTTTATCVRGWSVGRPHVPGHQRHRGAGPRLRAVRRHASWPSGWPGCSRSRCSIARAARLILARDGFGIKPLYLRRTADQLSFASEIRAFALDGEGALSVDPSVHAHVPAARLRPVARRRAFVGHRQAGARDACTRSTSTTGDTRSETFYRLAPAAHRRRAAGCSCWNGCASCSTRPCAAT